MLWQHLAQADTSLRYWLALVQEAVAAIQGSIDTELRASGFKREHQDALDRWVAQLEVCGCLAHAGRSGRCASLVCLLRAHF